METDSTLRPDDVQVWINCFDDADSPSVDLNSLLSASEMQRANAFRFDPDRERYIHSHAILRLILSRHTGIPPENIQYESGNHGKPQLVSDKPVYFNLSHTKELFAVAVSPKHPVGIDIEKKAYFDDIDSVACQFMSREEYREMNCLMAEAKVAYFYECWVQKEALVKAAGKGIDDHLQSFSVMNARSFEGRKAISTCFEGTQNTWQLKTFVAASDHLGAVCIASSNSASFTMRLRYHDSLEDLLRARQNITRYTICTDSDE